LLRDGIGNAASLPPLIAQAEFSEDRVPRVVALIVASAQAAYAFAPAIFGLLREFAAQPADAAAAAAPDLFAAAAFVQGLAISVFLLGRRKVGAYPVPAGASATAASGVSSRKVKVSCK
jgi:hypothetical protein